MVAYKWQSLELRYFTKVVVTKYGRLEVALILYLKFGAKVCGKNGADQ
jgi:hypothetical protein